MECVKSNIGNNNHKNKSLNYKACTLLMGLNLTVK